MIPFVNEPEMERVLEAARDAGATSASYMVLRLPWEVTPLFQHWLDAHFPDRAERVMAACATCAAARTTTRPSGPG